MAEQKAKAKGRKIGRWSRKPTNGRYKTQNKRDANKQARMIRADKDYERNYEARANADTDNPVKWVAHKDRYPGWHYTDGYGYTRI